MTTTRTPHPPCATILALLLLVAARPVRAHEFWLSPSTAQVSPGRMVEIRAVAGTGFRGEPQPWSPLRGVRFVARTRSTFDLARAASPGDPVWTRLVPNDNGGALLSFESGFTPIQLPAEQFDAYLLNEGLLEPLAARKQARIRPAGRERFRRCAKTWLAGDDVARATEPVGLPLEIVPLSVPGAASTLRVRVLWSGKPLAGALLKTWAVPLGQDGVIADVAQRDSSAVRASIRTDAHGEATLSCAIAGQWLVSVVHMVRSGAPAEADWESTWASLTFARTARDVATR